MNHSKVQLKVFNNSVVMEELISMLDPESLLHLIHSEILSKEVLQKSLTVRAWKDIIKHIKLDWSCDKAEETEGVENLTEVLELVKLPEPSKHLIVLLHRVCEVFTPRGHWGEDDVGVICSDSQEKFEVSPARFRSP